jgi:hypothetical protein
LYIISVFFCCLAAANGQSDGLDDRFRTQDTLQASEFVKPRSSLLRSTSVPVTLETLEELPGFQLNSFLPQIKRPEAGWSFSILTQPKIGYESNPLHSTNSSPGAGFFAFDFKPTVAFSTNDWLISATYAASGQFYADNRTSTNTSTDTADSLLQKMSAGASYVYNSNWQGSLSVFGTHLLANNRSFSDTYGALPSLAYNWETGWIVTAVSYTYDHYDDLTHPKSATLLDNANEHAPRLDASFYPSGPLAFLTNYTLTSLSLAYSHKWHNASGSLRTYQNDHLECEIDGDLLPSTLSYALTYAHDWRDYSAVGSGGPGIVRNDNANDVAAALTWKITTSLNKLYGNGNAGVGLFVKYDYQDKTSTKRSVEFGDHTVFAGIQLAL